MRTDPRGADHLSISEQDSAQPSKRRRRRVTLKAAAHGGASGKPASLATLAYERIRHDIIGGALRPGQKLLVADLRERYAIGLSPLRDALNRLCADGLAVKQEQKGFFVADLNEQEFLAITNARLVLEETALQLSIANGDAAWEETILVAFHRLSKAAKAGGKSFALTPEWAAAHEAFHVALLAPCGNEWILRFCAKLYEQSSRFRMRRRLISSASDPIRRHLLRAHEKILEACLLRDARLASDRLVQHYRLSLELVLGAPFVLLENPRRLEPSASPPEQPAKRKRLPGDVARNPAT